MSELSLSDSQLDILDEWKRPCDAFPPPKWPLPDGIDRVPVMYPTREIDLVQDAATDCSLVASLCSIMARCKSGHVKVLKQCFYPHNPQQPVFSKNGKYIIRLNFNGCWRNVVIDDCIPASTCTRSIHILDRNNPGLVWPALIEKAYLKVRGGYDFPGSNSGTDLWILTGWLPEQVFLQSDDIELDRLWERISSGFSFGDVLMTMGTGRMSTKTEDLLGLASEHDYAVLDIRVVDGQRLLLIKNPWCDGSSWYGRPKYAETAATQRNDVTVGHNSVNTEPKDGSMNCPRDVLNSDPQLLCGAFWMDLDSVLQYFESIYLNWNTGLFTAREDVHFAWNLTEATESTTKKPRGPHSSLEHTPQFTITTHERGIVWILLWRHFQNSIPEHATTEDIENDRHAIDLSGHISLAAFSSRGRRVTLPEKYVQKSWFVDSPQTLLKLEDCDAGQSYTIVPLEQELPATNHSFTISVFSNSPVALREAAPRYACSNVLAASWTRDTAGGNAQQPTYCKNPQFAIELHRKTSLSLMVNASNSQFNVHVKLVHSNSGRIHRIHNKDIITDSGDYRRGCCLAELEDLDPGQYVIICSTFEAQQLGGFTLVVESSHPTHTYLLPREGAGRIRTEIRPAVFGHDEHRVAVPLTPHRLTKLYAVALRDPQHQYIAVGHRSHVRLMVELHRGSARHVLAVSDGGEYADSGAGALQTDEFDLSPDIRRYGFTECWLVLDRLNASSEMQEESFTIELYTDQRDALVIGVWRALQD